MLQYPTWKYVVAAIVIALSAFYSLPNLYPKDPAVQVAARMRLNADRGFNPLKFEILPLAFVRGMNIEDAVVIVDETQNLSRSEARSLLTRMGNNVNGPSLIPPISSPASAGPFKSFPRMNARGITSVTSSVGTGVGFRLPVRSGQRSDAVH